MKRIHIFICTNKKSAGKCCAQADSDRYYEYLRQEINNRREQWGDQCKVKVVKTSCLGRCAEGPNILISPDNVWYTFSCKEDIDEILLSHVIQGKVVTRLINHEVG